MLFELTKLGLTKFRLIQQNFNWVSKIFELIWWIFLFTIEIIESSKDLLKSTKTNKKIYKLIQPNFSHSTNLFLFFWWIIFISYF